MGLIYNEQPMKRRIQSASAIVASQRSSLMAVQHAR